MRSPNSTTVPMIAVFLLMPSLAMAETPTLEGLLARMEDDSVVEAVLEAPARAEENLARLEARFPGPGIESDVKYMPSVEQEVEVAVGQDFPLGGVRKAHREARFARAAALRARGHARIDDRAADLAEDFYRAVSQQERIGVLEERRRAVDRARQSLARRQEVGDISTYELERMEREVRRAEIAIEREKVALRAALDRLASLVDAEPFEGVDGTLMPTSCGGEPTALPQVEALNREIEATEHEQLAAKRGWVPTLSARVGWVGIGAAGQFEQGMIGGLGLSFPFWAYGDYAEAARSAQIIELNAERELLERSTRHLSDSLGDRCRELLQVAEQANAGIAQSATLLERAEAGYAAGELTLLDLVDAQTALLEDRLQYLELLAAARQAQNDWLRVTGGWR